MEMTWNYENILHVIFVWLYIWFIAYYSTEISNGCVGSVRYIQNVNKSYIFMHNKKNFIAILGVIKAVPLRPFILCFIMTFSFRIFLESIMKKNSEVEVCSFPGKIVIKCVCFSFVIWIQVYLLLKTFLL